MPAHRTNPNKMVFRTRLEAERAFRGLSRYLMADLLGVKTGRYNSWEYQASIPKDEDTRGKLVKYFQVGSIEALFSPVVVVGGEITTLD